MTDDRDALALWLADPAGLDDPAARAAALAVLDADDRERMEHYRFERDRRLHLAAHALVRMTLSRHAPVAAEAWRFAAEPGGRPVLVGPAPVPPLAFSISHCAGLVACAVAERAVGVDVEAIAAIPEDVAARVLAPAEAAALAALSADARPERFYATWTLKEAYVKARGAGLALPLPAIAFRFDDRGAAQFEPGGELDDDPAAWTFAWFRPTRGHCAALCVAHTPTVVRPHVTPRWGRWATISTS